MTFTDPQDIKDMAIWVMGWDDDGVRRQAGMFRDQGYSNVFEMIDKNHHETTNMNAAIDRTVERGISFWHMSNDDVEYRYTETLPAMYDYIKSHPDVGVIHPWLQGEDAEPGAIPYEFYLQDATALILRLNINGWLPQWDTEYLFTGWSDLALGLDVQRHGGRIVNDKRYPVKHVLGNTRRRAQCSYLMANERRNRLLLSSKWFIVGPDKWRGVDEYNRILPPHKRIPSMYELAAYTDDELEIFWRSVHPEHPQIWRMNGELDPMDYWENPIVGGKNIREMWEQGWRP